MPLKQARKNTLVLKALEVLINTIKGV